MEAKFTRQQAVSLTETRAGSEAEWPLLADLFHLVLGLKQETALPIVAASWALKGHWPFRGMKTFAYSNHKALMRACNLLVPQSLTGSKRWHSSCQASTVQFCVGSYALSET